MLTQSPPPNISGCKQKKIIIYRCVMRSYAIIYTIYSITIIFHKNPLKNTFFILYLYNIPKVKTEYNLPLDVQ